MSICSVCGEKVPNWGAKIIRGKSGQWVCKECLKKAGIGSLKFSNNFITADQIRSMIDNDNKINNQINMTKTSQKQNSPQNIIVTVAIVLVCLIATIGIISVLNSSNLKTSQTNTASEIEYIEVTANELYNAFEANEVAADEKYKGKYVKVTGVVTEISSGGTFTDACILLNAESSIIFGDVQCNFSNDEAAKKISELNKNDTVTIIGKCGGLGTININIYNCEIQ